MSDIPFNCPSCQQSLEAPSDMAGTSVACPTCNTTILVPRPATPSQARAFRSVPLLTTLVGVLCLALIGAVIAIVALSRSRTSPETPVAPIENTTAAADARRLEEDVAREAAQQRERERMRQEREAQRLAEEKAQQKQETRRLAEEKARIRNATLRAWNALQAADNAMRQYQNLTPSQRQQQQAYLYSQVDLAGVDPILQEHFRDSISVCKYSAQILAQLEAEYAKTQENTAAAAGLGALLGAAGSDGYNPQADALGGALLLGIIGGAVGEAQWQETLNTYKPYLERIVAEHRRIAQRDIDIAEELSKKYDTVFIDAF